MNRRALVAHVAQRHGLPRRQVNAILTTILGTIQDSLIHGEKVTLAGFGQFDAVMSAKRKGHNPHTGERLTIPPRRRARFTAGSHLKDAIDHAAEDRLA